MKKFLAIVLAAIMTLSMMSFASASELAGNGRDQLHSILTELLENAVEYTPEGGDVIFCVRELMTDDRNSTIEFYVQDDGAGIPEEQLRKLRSMTRQEEAEADHGLAAVCREVRRLRGTVTFESGNGRGMGTVARVILTMPVSRVRPVRPLPKTPAIGPATAEAPTVRAAPEAEVEPAAWAAPEEPEAAAA